ncbi:multidrug efflux SMR transporter [Lactobacillaceae bacterium L1_55_11]|nr:multidrug efflux SMR transporter [Lactobacillaceae bacterium L1_55_11]
MGYFYLLIAVIAEIAGSNLVVSSQGFTKWQPTLLCLACYGLAFFMLSKTVETIPLHIAYAIWSGAGIVLVTVMSVLFWKAQINWPTIFGLLLIIVGIVIVNLYGNLH